MHMDDPVSNRCDGRIMRNYYNSCTFLSAHVLQNLKNLFPRVIVQCTGRLVTKQYFWILGNCSGYCNSLLLAA